MDSLEVDGYAEILSKIRQAVITGEMEDSAQLTEKALSGV